MMGLPSGKTLAQGPPPIALKKIDGPNGAGATEALRRALERQHQFRLVPTPGGVPEARATAGAGFLEGTLLGGDGRVLFRQKYQRGNPVQNVRQFADDMVLTLTKRPGIATSQIAFSLNRGGQPQVYLCDFDGGNVRQITSKGANTAPAIAPDGTRLAYVTLRDADRGEIVVIDLTNEKIQKIGGGSFYRPELCFSPDGKTLAATLGAEGSGGNTDLFLVKFKGGKPKALLQTPAPEHAPAWSPDGREILFAAAATPGPSVLYRLPVKKKAPQVVQTGFPDGADPSWSPDGGRIAFVSSRTVCVHEFATRQTRRIGNGASPAWGADSRHLVFTDGYSLIVVDTATGKKETILGGGGSISHISWTR